MPPGSDTVTATFAPANTSAYNPASGTAPVSVSAASNTQTLTATSVSYSTLLPVLSATAFLTDGATVLGIAFFRNSEGLAEAIGYVGVVFHSASLLQTRTSTGIPSAMAHSPRTRAPSTSPS